MGFTVQQIREGIWTEEILRLAREADLGITGVSARDVSVPDVLANGFSMACRDRCSSLGNVHSWERVSRKLKIRHRRFDSAGESVGETEFDIQDESEGTQQLIALAGPLLDVLKGAKAMFFDELDARLHPRLTRRGA
ncbi:MAG: AAA family ATPase [Microthrixaceae bacterium]